MGSLLTGMAQLGSLVVNRLPKMVTLCLKLQSNDHVTMI